jgi:hypothetical protein
MIIKRLRPALLATAIALAGCGGGGGGGVASIPPPPVAPAPPPTQSAPLVLVKSATTDQQFPVEGASYQSASTQTPMLGPGDQLQIRYVASSNTYEVQLPNSQTWIGLTARSEYEASGGGVTVLRQFSDDYGSVFRWSATGSFQGVEAVGIPTAASAIPVSGSATYTAFALGSTSEVGGGKIMDRSVLASMILNFDFGAGSLTGRIVPELDPEWHDYPLDTLNFRDTVYSVGKTTFSGKFDTSLPGVNSFEGLFTGPAAQGVIGNFAFPYRSPLDGQTYQAGGAFVGKQ